MGTVPTPANPSIVDEAVKALAPFHPESREQVADMLLFWIRRDGLTEQDITEVQDRLFPPVDDAPAKTSGTYRDGYTEGYLDAIGQVARLRAGNAKVAELRERLLACPDWCTLDHADDDPGDPINNLILHQGDDHTDGYVRKMLDTYPGGGTKLDIRLTRTDCPQEGTVGTPALYVRADVEVTSWEQAAELARAILDGFGYLEGADRS